jgi:hypothetical protein
MFVVLNLIRVLNFNTCVYRHARNEFVKRFQNFIQDCV